MMDEQPITCELVDQQELDRRYVEGRLSEAEAAAFEEHYFGCERCWHLVKGGAGVRAALQQPGTVSAVRPRWWRKPLAIAAGIALVALGTWRIIGSGSAVDPDGIRGAGDSLAVRTSLSSGVWHLVWPAAGDVTSYRVRVSASDGRLLFTRQVSDTTLEIAADSLPLPRDGTPLYLDVQGFDELRRPVARSPLVPLSAPSLP